MDTVFDTVSRFLAQPRPRRATLRIVVGTAAGAVTGMLPKHGYAWTTPIPCNANTCDGNTQVCCDWNLSLCCAKGTCLKNATGENVCCPTGKVCGGLCCGVEETCCGSGSSSVCCATLNGKAICKNTGTVAVCERVPTSTCDQTVCSSSGPAMTCVNNVCKCDETRCQQLGAQVELPLTCATSTGTCGPVGS